jgi:hypothetical protein
MKKLVRESLNERNLYRDERPNEPLTNPVPTKDVNKGFWKNTIESLITDFEQVGFEVDVQDDGFWAENDNGVRAFIQQAGENFNILVQGMSDDVPIYDIDYRSVLDIFQDLDEEWLIENDPEGDQY